MMRAANPGEERTKMSDKKRWPLAVAQEVAKQLMARLAPVCTRMVVAGSVRRQKPDVSDIELVFVPRLVRRHGTLFDDEWESAAGLLIDRLVHDRVLAMRPSVHGTFTWGESNRLAVDVESGIPVDLFASTDAGWWRTLVIRTGPRELNIRLITSAARAGIKVHAYGEPALARIDGGLEVPCESERQFFELCGVPWAEPEDRR